MATSSASSVRVQISNNVPAYNITGLSHHAQLPDWLAKKNAKSLKKDPSWSKRITLIQDFGFPEAALRLKFAPNAADCIVGCGVYKPQLRVFDLSSMSLKFERHTTAETVDFEFLGDSSSNSGWQKMVLLGSDRSVAFHGAGEEYYSTRIPRAGRALRYDERTAELLLVGSSPDVYRLNLDRGQFMASLETSLSPAEGGGGGGLNAVDIGPWHGLYGVAGDGGLIELWDRRDRARAAGLQGAGLEDTTQTADMTSLRFLPNGLHMAVGDSLGIVRLFDIRSARPLHCIDHKYGEPIRGIQYHSASNTLLSFDSQALRITSDPRNTCVLHTTISSSNTSGGVLKINDVCSDGESGFVALAVEDSQIAAYYIPSLGAAPRWASYLDTIIDSTEDAAGAHGRQAMHYDNYRFVTRDQLHDLGLAHLIGGRLLRAYMHGFFVDSRLYEKARAISNPFALDEYRREQAIKKMEAERASRITAAIPKKKSAIAAAAASDERFKALLANDDDYRIDEEDGHHHHHRSHQPTPHSTKKPKKVK